MARTTVDTNGILPCQEAFLVDAPTPQASPRRWIQAKRGLAFAGHPFAKLRKLGHEFVWVQPRTFQCPLVQRRVDADADSLTTLLPVSGLRFQHVNHGSNRLAVRYVNLGPVIILAPITNWVGLMSQPGA